MQSSDINYLHDSLLCQLYFTRAPHAAIQRRLKYLQSVRISGCSKQKYCIKTGCDKLAQGGTNKCKAHGGGNRCTETAMYRSLQTRMPKEVMFNILSGQQDIRNLMTAWNSSHKSYPLKELSLSDDRVEQYILSQFGIAYQHFSIPLKQTTESYEQIEHRMHNWHSSSRRVNILHRRKDIILDCGTRVKQGDFVSQDVASTYTSALIGRQPPSERDSAINSTYS